MVFINISEVVVLHQYPNVVMQASRGVSVHTVTKSFSSNQSRVVCRAELKPPRIVTIPCFSSTGT